MYTAYTNITIRFSEYTVVKIKIRIVLNKICNVLNNIPQYLYMGHVPNIIVHIFAYLHNHDVHMTTLINYMLYGFHTCKYSHAIVCLPTDIPQHIVAPVRLEQLFN
jgi:hypothetical protein